jgi:hypothetical protein
MNPADEVPKRETTERQLDGAAADSVDSLKGQFCAAFKEFERSGHQSKPAEDLHGSDHGLEPLRTTPKDFQRPNPQWKPAQPVQKDDLHSRFFTPYPDHEALERKAIYDRLAAIENEMKRPRGGFGRYLVAILIGVAVTLAWQSCGDAAKQIIATRAPELGWSPQAKQMIASWVAQLGWTKLPAGSEKQAAPVVQTAPAAPSIDPEKVQQMMQNLVEVRETVQEIAAGQTRVKREIDKLESAVVEILMKIPESPPQPPAAAARKPAPVPPPSSRAPAAQPSSRPPQ